MMAYCCCSGDRSWVSLQYAIIAICHHSVPCFVSRKKGKRVAPTRRMDIVMSTCVAPTRRMDIVMNPYGLADNTLIGVSLRCHDSPIRACLCRILADIDKRIWSGAAPKPVAGPYSYSVFLWTFSSSFATVPMDFLFLCHYSYGPMAYSYDGLFL